MVQLVSNSNSGQNVVGRLLDTSAELKAGAIKSSKTSAEPDRIDNSGPQVASQSMLQNLISVMSQLLDTLKSMLTQFMQGFAGLTTAAAESAAASGASGQVPLDSLSTGIKSDSATSTDSSAAVEDVAGGHTNVSDPNLVDPEDGVVDALPTEEQDLLPEELAQFRAATKPATPRDPLQALTDDKGLPTVLTEDGYTIHCDADKASWNITGPDGKTTQIWGDPHVVESDNDKWDFKNQSTFKFGNNKVTVQVVPFKDGSASVSSRITVYSGEQRVTIGGIDKAQARIEASANDGRTHDAALQDGDTYQRSLEPGRGDGEQWKKVASVQ